MPTPGLPIPPRFRELLVTLAAAGTLTPAGCSGGGGGGGGATPPPPSGGAGLTSGAAPPTPAPPPAPPVEPVISPMPRGSAVGDIAAITVRPSSAWEPLIDAAPRTEPWALALGPAVASLKPGTL